MRAQTRTSPQFFTDFAAINSVSWKCSLRLPALPFQISVQEEALTPAPGVFSYISVQKDDIKFILDDIKFVLLVGTLCWGLSPSTAISNWVILIYTGPTVAWYDATKQHVSCTPIHNSPTLFNRREQSHIASCITSRLVRERLALRSIFLRSRWSPFGSVFLLLKY